MGKGATGVWAEAPTEKRERPRRVPPRAEMSLRDMCYS